MLFVEKGHSVPYWVRTETKTPKKTLPEALGAKKGPRTKKNDLHGKSILGAAAR